MLKLESTYKGYLSLMRLGGFRITAENHGDKQRPIETDASTPEELDKSATEDGNNFRGAGVLIGLLGIAIVFCAVATTAFHIEEASMKIAFGAAKVVMMTLMLLIVWWYGKHKYLKERWIAKRKEAERLRYEPLRQLTADFSRTSDTTTAEKLRSSLEYLLFDEDDGQLAYNLKKATLYKKIETTTNRITGIAFGVAFLAAIRVLASDINHEMFPEIHWLILLTAFSPALVGGLHGINGFLNIPALADDHAKMGASLLAIKADFEAIDAGNPADHPKLQRIADDAYQQLMGRDAAWAEQVAKAELKPAA